MFQFRFWQILLEKGNFPTIKGRGKKINGKVVKNSAFSLEKCCVLAEKWCRVLFCLGLNWSKDTESQINDFNQGEWSKITTARHIQMENAKSLKYIRISCGKRLWLDKNNKESEGGRNYSESVNWYTGVKWAEV